MRRIIRPSVEMPQLPERPEWGLMEKRPVLRQPDPRKKRRLKQRITKKQAMKAWKKKMKEKYTLEERRAYVQARLVRENQAKWDRMAQRHLEEMVKLERELAADEPDDP